MRELRPTRAVRRSSHADADADTTLRLAEQTMALRERLAAAIPARMSHDQGAVILREFATGLCYVGFEVKRGTTFVEYVAVGHGARTNPRVRTEGKTEWQVVVEQPDAPNDEP